MEDLYSMTDEFMTLKDFIHLLTQGTRLHVCIHDVSNLLSINLMQLDYHNTIHYEDTCNFAKTTKKGLTPVSYTHLDVYKRKTIPIIVKLGSPSQL